MNNGRSNFIRHDAYTIINSHEWVEDKNLNACDCKQVIGKQIYMGYSVRYVRLYKLCSHCKASKRAK